jgi:hypothetical protein
MAWFTAKNMLSMSKFIDAFIEISGLFLAYRVKEVWGGDGICRETITHDQIR